MNAQASILPGVPRVARYLTFSCKPGSDLVESRESVQALNVDEQMVVGIGEPL